SCFFISSRRRHTRSKRDWSSDVCSSDLVRIDCRPRRMSTNAQRASKLVDLRGFTILVLENDPDTLELLRAILDACGARVLLADKIGRASCRERVWMCVGDVSLLRQNV